MLNSDNNKRQTLYRGFTLIELSIVIVVIGLLVGGVLVGRDLIAAAEIRSQISQLEKYNTAVNTFKLKYGYLPGDTPQAVVTAFGFTASISREGSKGRGDANGIIEPFSYRGYGSSFNYPAGGESLFFWSDLSTNSGLIAGNFNSAVDDSSFSGASGSSINNYLPLAKINNSYVYVANISNQTII